MGHPWFWVWIIFLILLLIGSGVAFAYYKSEHDTLFGFFTGAGASETYGFGILFFVALVLLVVSLLVWFFYLKPSWENKSLRRTAATEILKHKE